MYLKKKKPHQFIISFFYQYHPDANPNDPQAQQKFVKLQEAYNVLSSPVERARYDVKTNRASYKTP